MVKLDFYDPSGGIEVTQPHAPRLDSLAGKRIGVVTNEQWQAFRTLPLLKKLFEQDFHSKFAIQLGIPTFENGPHTSSGDFAENLVAMSFLRTRIGNRRRLVTG